MDRRERREADGEIARLRALVVHAPTLFAVMEGPEHVFRLANPAYLRVIGRGEGDIVGRTFRTVFPAVAGEGFDEALDQVYASGEPYVGTEQPVWFDRSDAGRQEAFFTFVFQPLRDAAGDVEGILMNGVEVTAEVQARRRLHDLAAVSEAARARLQQVVDVLPEGIVVVDVDGRAVLANHMAADLMGPDIVGRSMTRAEREAVVASGIRRLDGTPYPTEDLPLERSVGRGEEVRGVQLLLRHAADGRDIPALLNSAPLRDAAGAITGAVLVFQDITTIKNFERARDGLLATVTHDLKNPLTAIQGIAELTGEQAARTGTPSNERIAARQGAIVTAATQMTALLNELLDAMQLQMGQPLALDRRPTDLLALMRRTVDHQREIAERPIHVEADAPEVICDVDADRIERVIGNLVSNAIKYSPTGEGVTVRVAREQTATGAWAVLTVADRGAGIPAEDLPHVFERFYRGENTGGVQGAGIGLASVREIVEQHGGTVTVESREGTGTTATVRLPLAGLAAA